MTEKQIQELVKEEKRRYKREWYQKNKEHVKEYYRNYRKENADKLKQQSNEYWKNKALGRLENAEKAGVKHEYSENENNQRSI